LLHVFVATMKTLVKAGSLGAGVQTCRRRARKHKERENNIEKAKETEPRRNVLDSHIWVAKAALP
jgi:hypothetical protein